jgi:hypothetical protein
MLDSCLHLGDSRINCRSNPVYLKQRPDSYVMETVTVILKKQGLPP